MFRNFLKWLENIEMLSLFFSAVKHIYKIQVFYNSKHALKHALPHVATRCESLAKEVLGFVCILLLNANQLVQVHAHACACLVVASRAFLLKSYCLSMSVVCSI